MNHNLESIDSLLNVLQWLKEGGRLEVTIEQPRGSGAIESSLVTTLLNSETLDLIYEDVTTNAKAFILLHIKRLETELESKTEELSDGDH